MSYNPPISFSFPNYNFSAFNPQFYSICYQASICIAIDSDKFKICAKAEAFTPPCVTQLKPSIDSMHERLNNRSFSGFMNSLIIHQKSMIEPAQPTSLQSMSPDCPQSQKQIHAEAMVKHRIYPYLALPPHSVASYQGSLRYLVTHPAPSQQWRRQFETAH